jgi:choline-sulfatase
MRFTIIAIITFFIPCLVTGAEAGSGKPNVLFIAIDDQNDWIGCLHGHPQVKTPHIDRLARMGTLFTNAHCQAPLCNPSRTSILFGKRPTSTGVYGLVPGPRSAPVLANAKSLTQAFMENGYETFVGGKIYHDGSIPPKAREQECKTWGPAPGMPKPPKPFVITPGKHPAMDWGVFPKNDSEQADWKIASWGCDILSNKHEKPWFLGVGFRLPHVPCYASQKWFDLYPKEVALPPVKDDDRADTPEFSWYLHWKLPEPRLSWLKRENQWQPLVKSYLASISFMDSQVGRLLDTLEAKGLSQNTIVVLWSDHGWHLGEKGITGKNSLWERSTRVPLIFSGPGITKDAKCNRPAELLDMFPTLVQLCSLKPVEGLEGHDLSPLLMNSSAAREWPAITSHNQGNHAVRSERWRYIRYADGSEELYDHCEDPNEWKNLAKDPAFKSIVADHAKWLPKVDLPPIANSAHRILTWDPKTKTATWEGKPVILAEKED